MICVINIQVSLPKIRKKSGNYVNYDSNKVFQVILNSLDDSDAVQDRSFNIDTVSVASEITHDVNEEVENLNESALDVETMQNIIYHQLIEHDEVIAAREYLHYSDKKMQKKNDNADLVSAISKVFNKDPQVMHENANKDGRTFSTQRDLIVSQVFRELGLKMYPKEVQKAHKEGLIHLHDLDMSPLLPYSNCCNINVKDMLENGFKVNEINIEKPKSIKTASTLTAEIIALLSEEQYGGCSIAQIDELFAPYAKQDYKKHLLDAKKYNITNYEEYAWNLTKRDIYQAMESLEYNINFNHARGGQVPFTSVSFGLGTDKFEKEIQSAILKVRIKGLGKDKVTAIFPKLIFFIKDGVNLKESDPNYDIKQLAIKCSSLRDYPDIMFDKNIKEVTGAEDIPMTPMGCRSQLPAWINPATGKEQVSGRLNMGVVTLNLPHIAMESNNLEDFWNKLKQGSEIVHKALQLRIEKLRQVKPQEAPLIWQQGGIARLKDDEDVTPILKNGRCTASFGYCGLYEAATRFYGSEWEHNKEAYDFVLDIAKYIHNLCQKWYKEEGYWYSEYGTPLESTTDTFCRKDKRQFGEVKDITDKGFYVNSFHYAPWKDVSPFEKLKFEAPFPKESSGGNIDYIEYESDIRNNLSALEQVWNYANEVGIAYLGTNCPISKCLACGYSGDIKQDSTGFECPQCGNREQDKLQVVIRTCGYLSSLSERTVVEGRMKEMQSRVHHNMGMLGIDEPVDDNHVIIQK